MIKEAYNTFIKNMQVMDEDSNVDISLIPKDLDDKKLIEMYKFMNLGRAVSNKLLALQRLGKVATFAPLNGEEAVQVGSAYAMDKNDYIVPIYRTHLSLIVRGVPLKSLFTAVKGYEEAYSSISDYHATPEIIVVGSQFTHAAGIAYGLKYRKIGNAVIVYGGDGSTSEGDFYEAINFAGVFNLPVIFMIENNEWAISVPRSRQSAAETLAQKGVAAGIKSIQVDGNDVLAVYKATKDALESIKQNGKPVLIEALTYRMGMHTTSDDPTKYRPEEDVDAWQKKDPIKRLQRYLISKKIWNDEMEQSMIEENKELVNQAAKDIESVKSEPEKMFDNVYSFIPETLQEEKDEAVKNNFWQ